MSGRSMTGYSHAAVSDRRRAGDPSSERPSGLSGCDQIVGGDNPRLLSSLFHNRYIRPSGATNGRGSIEPPSSTWHRNGASDESTNGPAGVGDVAIPMHWSPDEASCAV